MFGPLLSYANFETKSSLPSKKSRRTVVSKPINLDSKERMLEFLDRFDYILSDCDGVLWLSDSAVPGAPSAINKLRSMGKKIM